PLDATGLRSQPPESRRAAAAGWRRAGPGERGRVPGYSVLLIQPTIRPSGLRLRSLRMYVSQSRGDDSSQSFRFFVSSCGASRDRGLGRKHRATATGVQSQNLEPQPRPRRPARGARPPQRRAQRNATTQQRGRRRSTLPYLSWISSYAGRTEFTIDIRVDISHQATQEADLHDCTPAALVSPRSGAASKGQVWEVGRISLIYPPASSSSSPEHVAGTTRLLLRPCCDEYNSVKSSWIRRSTISRGELGNQTTQTAKANEGLRHN
ncbi:hypothetical protein THAOC_04896, partial [Thalassiosira oceanica]